MSQFRNFGGLTDMTPVVKNLLILNVLVFLACLVYEPLMEILAMHYPSNPDFRPWQLITHMFTHGGWMHIFFNMFALVNFGMVLEHERILGSKRFAFLYLFSGMGAIFFHLLVNGLMVYHYTGSFYIDNATSLPPTLSDKAIKNLSAIYYSGVVGASGAIYGLLAAFGYLFPNAPLLFLFVPVPIKAKYMIPLVIIAYDIAFAQYGLDNIAHYAHIGGALFGFLLVLFWNKNNKKTFY
jgi:rhomboid-like protein